MAVSKRQHTIHQKKANKKRLSAAPIVRAYQGATKGLQNVGANMARNVAQGQKSLKPGAPGYGAIDPFKNTGKAFMSGFKKKSIKK